MEKSDEKISIVVNITKEDLYKYNLYLAKGNKNIGMIIASSFILLCGIYGLIFEKHELRNILLNSLLLILGILGYLLVFVFEKLITKRRIKKLKLADLKPVNVTLSAEGILYCFLDEKDDPRYKPFSYSDIYKVVLTDEYIYVHSKDRSGVLLIPTIDLKDDAFINYLKNALAPFNSLVDKRTHK